MYHFSNVFSHLGKNVPSVGLISKNCSMLTFCVYSPDQGQDASETLVQTLGAAQVQYPGHSLRPGADPGADGARPEVGAPVAGVRHAEGVRHVQPGGADPPRGPAGDEQVRKILRKGINRLSRSGGERGTRSWHGCKKKKKKRQVELLQPRQRISGDEAYVENGLRSHAAAFLFRQSAVNAFSSS